MSTCFVASSRSGSSTTSSLRLQYFLNSASTIVRRSCGRRATGRRAPRRRPGCRPPRRARPPARPRARRRRRRGGRGTTPGVRGEDGDRLAQLAAAYVSEPGRRVRGGVGVRSLAGGGRHDRDLPPGACGRADQPGRSEGLVVGVGADDDQAGARVRQVQGREGLRSTASTRRRACRPGRGGRRARSPPGRLRLAGAPRRARPGRARRATGAGRARGRPRGGRARRRWRAVPARARGPRGGARPRRRAPRPRAPAGRPASRRRRRASPRRRRTPPARARSAPRAAARRRRRGASAPPGRAAGCAAAASIRRAMPTAPPNHTAATPMPPHAKPGRSRYHPGAPTARAVAPARSSGPESTATRPRATHVPGTAVDRVLRQVDGEELALLAHPRADQRVVQHAPERAPVLAPGEDVRRPVGLGAQRLAGTLGGEDAPGAGRRGLAGLLEDRERVEVRLEGARDGQVGRRDARQRRPHVRGAPGAGCGQPPAQVAGEGEGGGHVARRPRCPGGSLGELVPLGVGSGSRAGPDPAQARTSRSQCLSEAQRVTKTCRVVGGGQVEEALVRLHARRGDQRAGVRRRARRACGGRRRR